MNMKNILAAAALLTAGAAAAAPYHLTAPMSEDAEGAMVYLVNFDTDERIDSVLVADGVAEFRGTIDEPVLARLLLDGQRYCTFILEEGGIAINKERDAVGSMLNDRLNDIGRRSSALAAVYRSATDDTARQAVVDRFNAFMESALAENADNPIGYYIFLDQAGGLSRQEFAAALAKYPAFASYKRVQRYQQSFDRQEATAEGKPFTDFEIEYNGEKHRLSDIVGKGDYVLVDYWASWCGPCIRETKVLKELLNEYGPQGLEVLGVAVWDEPDNTLAAIKRHNLPWPQIINAQTIPTDLYGITGIPCILLIGPDGTILSRDKQDDALRADIRAYFDGTLTPESLAVPADSIPNK